MLLYDKSSKSCRRSCREVRKVGDHLKVNFHLGSQALREIGAPVPFFNGEI